MMGLEVMVRPSDQRDLLLLVMNKPILIIDDDRPVRRALRLLLEGYAFDCKEADDGLGGGWLCLMRVFRWM